MRQTPRPLQKAQYKLKRNKALLRLGRFIIRAGTVPGVLIILAIATVSFVTGLALGYVALRDWNEGAAFLLGLLLALAASFMSILGTAWAFRRIRSWVLLRAETQAQASNTHVQELESKLNHNPELAEASSGLSLSVADDEGSLTLAAQVESTDKDQQETALKPRA